MAALSTPPCRERCAALAQNILQHFAEPPSLRDVALRVLQHHLGTQYPWLPINHTEPILLRPVYRYDNGSYTIERHDAQNLPDALIERCATGRFVDFAQDHSIVRDVEGLPLPLNVDIGYVERMLNQQGPVLLERYQEALVDYWMSRGEGQVVRYIGLADILRNALMDAATHAALAGTELDLVMSLISRSQQTSHLEPANGQAYIVDQWGETGAINLEMLRGLVLVKQQGERTTVLLFTLSKGIQRFDSLAQLGEWLVNLLSAIASGHSMQWRLYQPAGNIFYSFSLTFLAKQLADINAVLSLVRTFPEPQYVLERAMEVITADFDSTALESPLLERLRNALPGWLIQAPNDLQLQMSRHVLDLARQVRQPDWRAFDEGVPSLLDYARQGLSAQLAKDHPGEPVLDPDRIKVMIELDERDLQTQPALLWQLPPLYNHGSWTLSEFAWLPLTAVDPARLTLTAAPGDPDVSLTPAQALAVVARADVRGGYNRLIREKFKDNESERRWRQAQFIRQVRLQIPMLALEYHLKYPQAFSRKAYTSVVAVFQPRAAAKTEAIVLRPLAFNAQVGEQPDTVRNTFIIGPRNLNAGPQILYRPMCAVKFIEFATADALMAAIASPGQLQYQVLAWLPETARSRYLVPGVTAPSPAAFEAVDFNQSLWSGDGIVLADREVDGDYMEALFSSSVDTMLSLTEPVEPTALEVFWDWIKRFLGVGLFLLLTFYGGAVGRALGWLYLAWSVVQDVRVIGQEHAEDKASSVADLLLNIGLLLLSRGRISTKAGVRSKTDDLLDLAQGADLEQSIEMSWSEAAEHPSEGGQTSRIQTPTVQLPTVQGPEELVRGAGDLERLWSGLFQRLSVIRLAELALYKVRPLPYAERISSGQQRGLFRAGGAVYASIDGDMYKVEQHQGATRVVSDDLVNRFGPQVVAGEHGQWLFSPGPVVPHDFQEALALEKQRLAQLKSAEQRRKALDDEYNQLVLKFAGLVYPADDTLQVLTQRSDEPGTLALIEEELANASTAFWCSSALMEALTRRREMMLIREFSALYNRFAAGAVKARRNQTLLLASKRKVMLHDDLFNAAWFDAQSLSKRVLDTRTWGGIAARLPDYAALELEAIEACLDAERRFEDMKRSGRIGDTAVAALDNAAWAGGRMSLKWQELHLRTLALQCFNGRVSTFRDATMDLIEELTALCSLKLLTYRELYTTGRFNLDHQLRVANDALDGVVLANLRVAYHLAPLPPYIVPQALGNFRSHVRRLQLRLEEELIERYRHYQDASLEAISTKVTSMPKRLIDDGILGAVIGNPRSVLEQSVTHEYVDVLEPFDHRPVFTFERPGVEQESLWRAVPRLVTPPDNDDALQSLADIGNEALRLWRNAQREYDLLCGLETIQRLSPRLARGEWWKYAQRMRTQRELLIKALNARPDSPGHRDLQDFFRHTPSALYDEILRYMEEGSAMRDRMIMKYSPTSEGLLQLYKAWKVDVVERPSSVELIREFEVREKSSGRPLWLARFHYRTRAARDIGYHFIRGYLKRFVERNISYKKLTDYAANNRLQLINVLRSNIDHEVAETVFFTEDVSSTVR
ncbi:MULTISPECIES: dermonecrotic toxin domain-containing protein [unclassified Pseudomonas]|uniref:dermonecrotic toxin domain-containing protein n=1 Tax=unclassified Pseudomonas TaxID=196821 RepID=UPI0008E5CFD0|nr:MULTISPECIES: DUF6543 domain-containing protein [unclassified Pseudomonas]SFI71750.1 hypothetical protein SAMN03159342_04716 [Pseudomonas sp. NFPP04]SFJ83080.1 hypothetical protein SAMN03159344_04720 [Pseudomonas sp. NFPP11]